MTGIVKTDQLQGAQSSTITIPTGNKISIADSATVGTLNATTMSGTPTFSGGIANTGTVSAGTLGSSVNFPTGHVLQVVQSNSGTGQSSTSSSFVEYTGGNVSITPSATSSKVLVMVTGSTYIGRNSVSQTYGQGRIKLYRGSTDLDIECTVGHNYGSISGGNSWADHGFAFSNVCLDSPNTTSSTTYKIYFKTDGSLMASVNGFGGKVVFTAMEIAG